VGLLTNIRDLDLVKTKVTGATLVKLPSLKRLAIGRSPTWDRGLSFISAMKSLEELEVHDLRLLPKAVETIASRRRLRRLLLWDTGLRESALAPLKGHPALESLYLQGMRLTSAGAEAIAAIPRLRSLSMGDGKLPGDVKGHLKKVRPSLDISD
jgi:hypothetical protein